MNNHSDCIQSYGRDAKGSGYYYGRMVGIGSGD